MEKIIKLHIEKLPEGFFLATSNDVQGLVAQGRTISETLEIARDVAKKLMESEKEEGVVRALDSAGNFDSYPLVVGF